MNFNPEQVKIQRRDPEKIDEAGAVIHDVTIKYLSELQNAYFVSAYNFQNTDEKTGNLAQQKALKKL